MNTWPKHPRLYQINTWTWLTRLSRDASKPVTLDRVPDKEWDRLGELQMDAVWLMGVWQRSPKGIELERDDQALLQTHREALSDFSANDVVGSPYCIRGYEVDESLGGKPGLAAARRALAARGLKLILDFVPNHVAPDHPWTESHPGYFILGSERDAMETSREYFQVGKRHLAHGRDPYFAPWADTAQLNAFSPALRSAMKDTLLTIADQCDGARCDMAMLLITDIFRDTWGSRAGDAPTTEYWEEMIPAVRKQHPEFLFVAEAYWDKEFQLQQQGFDYCYDKRLYDRLAHEDAAAIRTHLGGEVAYQDKLVRFIENHDEPRAAATMSPPRAKAAAAIITTLPGAILIHEGQMSGHRIKLPVRLGRRPVEPNDQQLQQYYETLLKRPRSHDANWTLCQDCPHSVLAWGWANDTSRQLIVINYSDAEASGPVALPWLIEGDAWQLADRMTGKTYHRNGNDLREEGVFVVLKAWQVQWFVFEQASPNA